MEKHLFNYQLNIADFNIGLFSNKAIELEEGYLPFINCDKTLKNDIDIECFDNIDISIINASELVFEAKNESQRFYSIYKNTSSFYFVIYNQQNRNSIQKIAFACNSFENWKIYSEPSDLPTIPLKYPMGPIILHYITLTAEAVMMHSSCAFDGKSARLFSGFSGAGKSTISKIMSDAGHQIINDDRIIIRKNENGYFAYNTPMYYRDISKKAALKSIFVISHSPENKIKKLSGATAVTKVMAFCIQNNFQQQFIQKRLFFFSELCSTLGVYELGFVPDKNVVNFIKSHENGLKK